MTINKMQELRSPTSHQQRKQKLVKIVPINNDPNIVDENFSWLQDQQVDPNEVADCNSLTLSSCLPMDAKLCVHHTE